MRCSCSQSTRMLGKRCFRCEALQACKTVRNSFMRCLYMFPQFVTAGCMQVLPFRMQRKPGRCQADVQTFRKLWKQGAEGLSTNYFAACEVR